MDEDWRNAFAILMCAEICDYAGAGAGIRDGAPSTFSSFGNNLLPAFFALSNSLIPYRVRIANGAAVLRYMFRIRSTI